MVTKFILSDFVILSDFFICRSGILEQLVNVSSRVVIRSRTRQSAFRKTGAPTMFVALKENGTLPFAKCFALF